ncbi:MAG: hypothetical protein WC989_09970 [Micavibrio sp.]
MRALVIAVLALCIGGAAGLAADQYPVPVGATVTIDEHGECRDVTNPAGQPAERVVFTKTAAEWTSVINNPNSLVIDECVSGSCLHTSISSGTHHSCAIATNNRLYCWGGNGGGQLGDGTTAQKNTPVAVLNGASSGNFISVSAGSLYTCALDAAGKAYCWGTNGSGQLGDGTTTSRTTPVLVANGAGPGTYKAIKAGGDHTCGLGTDDKAYCWGRNVYGQIGDGTTTNRSVPTLVANGAGPGTYKDVKAGLMSTCALGINDRAYCWGFNNTGLLGDGTTTQRTTPVLVLNGAGPGVYTAISGSGVASCGLSSDGKAYCWGTYVGDGTTSNRTTPVLVVNGAGPGRYKFLSAGGAQTCGLAENNKAYCWGAGWYGQLGNNISGGSYVSTTPVLVLNGSSPGTFSAIETSGLGAASGETCALGTDGRAYCWGRNWQGGVGNNNTSQQLVPALTLNGAGPGTYLEPSCSN